MEYDPVDYAEMEDLDADGFPELLIYTRSAGSGSAGTVIAYSVDDGKSMAPITLPDITENPEASKGYMGHDMFMLVNDKLIRSFQTYNENDANCCPTGKHRSISYYFKDDKSSPSFVVEDIVDFDR